MPLYPSAFGFWAELEKEMDRNREKNRNRGREIGGNKEID